MDSKKQDVTLRVILAVSLLYSTSSGIMQLMIPAYAVSLNINTAQLGFIIGLGGLGRLILIIPSGLLVDHYRANRISICSCSTSLVSTVLFLATKSPSTLAALVLVNFTAQSICFISLQVDYMNHIPNLSISNKGTGYQKTATLIGYNLIGNILGGFLLRSGNFNFGFGVVAIILSAGVVFMFISNIDDDYQSTETTNFLVKENIEQLIEMLKTGILLNAMLLETFVASSAGIFRTFIIPFALKNYGVTLQTISFVVLLQGSSAIVGAIAAELLAQITSQRRLMFLGASMIAVGSIIFSCYKVSVFLWSGSAVLGFGVGILTYTNYLRLSTFENYKGKAASLFSLGNGVGNVIGPLGGGLIGEALGISSVFWIPVAMLLILGKFILINDPLYITKSQTLTTIKEGKIPLC